MRMFFLDCGIMKFPYSVIARDMQPQDDSHKMVPAPISAFLIEHPEGRILFDTGCDPDGMKGNWPDAYRQIPYQESYLPQQLDELGIKPDDIGYVVASHLHFDHAGCLHICNKARIYVNKTELDTTMDAYRNGRELNAHLPSDIENWMRADLTWEPVSSETVPLVDGVTIVNFGPGHSWGMLGLMVELPGGNHFLVSDAIYTRENQGPPMKLPALLSDIEGYRKTIRRIESYAAENHATIVYGHDMRQYASWKARGCIE